ncbi:MAG: hypothetical protein AB9891_21900 [Anaerolineaceae bacterium]
MFAIEEDFKMTTTPIDSEPEEFEEFEEMKQKKNIFSKFGGLFTKGSQNNSPHDKPHGVFTFIAVLLFILVAISSFQLYRDIVADQRQALITRSVAAYTGNLDKLTTQMLSDYKMNVYNNAAVDSTSKQQVMGLEYNFNALMLLVKQNSRLIELIAQSR